MIPECEAGEVLIFVSGPPGEGWWECAAAAGEAALQSNGFPWLWVTLGAVAVVALVIWLIVQDDRLDKLEGKELTYRTGECAECGRIWKAARMIRVKGNLNPGVPMFCPTRDCREDYTRREQVRIDIRRMGGKKLGRVAQVVTKERGG